MKGILRRVKKPKNAWNWEDRWNSSELMKQMRTNKMGENNCQAILNVRTQRWQHTWALQCKVLGATAIMGSICWWLFERLDWCILLKKCTCVIVCSSWNIILFWWWLLLTMKLHVSSYFRCECIYSPLLKCYACHRVWDEKFGSFLFLCWFFIFLLLFF